MRAMLLALLCVTACAAPGGPEAQQRAPAEIVAAMPQDLPFLAREGQVTDFETNPATRGLGASVRYRGQRGLEGVATVYVYDRGAPRGPEGGASPDVERELASTRAEVQAVVQAGRYRAVSGFTPMAGGLPDGPRCLLFTLTQNTGAETRDAVCVTIRDRRFLKTRVTLRDQPDPRMAGMVADTLIREVSPRPATGLAPNT